MFVAAGTVTCAKNVGYGSFTKAAAKINDEQNYLFVSQYIGSSLSIVTRLHSAAFSSSGQSSKGSFFGGGFARDVV